MGSTVKVSRVRGPIVFGWSLLLQPKLSHKKLIIFIRRIIFICPPLRKYFVAIYCLVISEFFEKEFLIPQEDSIDYHHPEESPVNSTINPQSKIIQILSPYLSQFGLLQIFRSTRLYLITTEKKILKDQKCLVVSRFA